MNESSQTNLNDDIKKEHENKLQITDSISPINFTTSELDEIEQAVNIKSQNKSILPSPPSQSNKETQTESISSKPQKDMEYEELLSQNLINEGNSNKT